MKLRIKIGELELHVEGLEFTRKQVLKMLGETAGIALALSTEDDTETPTNPIGFSATLERAPDYQEQDLSEYFDE